MSLFENALASAIENLGRFDEMDKVVDKFYDDSDIDITDEQARAMLTFCAIYAESHHPEKNILLLFEAFRKANYKFVGILEPLNKITTRSFMNFMLRDFNIIESKETATPVKEEQETFEQGDYVKLIGDSKGYGIVEYANGNLLGVWTKDCETTVHTSSVRKVTDAKEKMIAQIVIDFRVGVIIDCYDSKCKKTASFMVIRGNEDGEYQLMDLDNHAIVPNSNTNSEYNIAYFIVLNIEPASIEVL